MFNDLLFPLDLADNLEIPFIEEIEQQCSCLFSFRPSAAASKKPRLIQVQESKYTITEMMNTIIGNNDSLESVQEQCSQFLSNMFENDNETFAEKYWESTIASVTMMAFFTKDGEEWLFQTFQEKPHYFISLLNLLEKELDYLSQDENETSRNHTDSLRASIWIWTLLLILMGSKTQKFFTKDGNLSTMSNQNTVHQLIHSAFPTTGNTDNYLSRDLTEENSISSRLRNIISSKEDSEEKEDSERQVEYFKIHLIKQILDLAEKTITFMFSKKMSIFNDSSVLVSIVMNIFPIMISTYIKEKENFTSEEQELLVMRLVDMVIFCICQMPRQKHSLISRFPSWEKNIIKITTHQLIQNQNEISYPMLKKIFLTLIFLLDSINGQLFINNWIKYILDMNVDYLHQFTTYLINNMLRFQNETQMTPSQKQKLIFLFFHFRCQTEKMSKKQMKKQKKRQNLLTDKLNGAAFLKLISKTISSEEWHFVELNNIIDSNTNGNCFVFIFSMFRNLRLKLKILTQFLHESIDILKLWKANINETQTLKSIQTQTFQDQLEIIVNQQCNYKNSDCSEFLHFFQQLTYFVCLFDVSYNLTESCVQSTFAYQIIQTKLNEFDTIVSTQCFLIWNKYLTMDSQEMYQHQIKKIVQDHLNQLQMPSFDSKKSKEILFEYTKELSFLTNYFDLSFQNEKWIYLLFWLLLNEEQIYAFLEKMMQYKLQMTLDNVQFIFAQFENINIYVFFQTIQTLNQNVENFSIMCQNCQKERYINAMTLCLNVCETSEEIFFILDFIGNEFEDLTKLIVRYIFDHSELFLETTQTCDIQIKPFFNQEETSEIFAQNEMNNYLSMLILMSSNYACEYLSISQIFHIEWNDLLFESIVTSEKLSQEATQLFLENELNPLQIETFVKFVNVHLQTSFIQESNLFWSQDVWSQIVHFFLQTSKSIVHDWYNKYDFCKNDTFIFDFIRKEEGDSNNVFNVILNLNCIETSLDVDFLLCGQSVSLRNVSRWKYVYILFLVKALMIKSESIVSLEKVSQLIYEIYSDRTRITNVTKELGSHLFQLLLKQQNLQNDSILHLAELKIKNVHFTNLHVNLYEIFIQVVLMELSVSKNIDEFFNAHKNWIESGKGSYKLGTQILDCILHFINEMGSHFRENGTHATFIEILLQQITWKRADKLFVILKSFNANHTIHDAILRSKTLFHLKEFIEYLSVQVQSNRYKVRIHLGNIDSLVNNADKTFVHFWKFVLNVLNGHRDGLTTKLLARKQQIIVLLLTIWKTNQTEEICLGTIQCFIQLCKMDAFDVPIQFQNALYGWIQENKHVHALILELNNFIN
jgi:hypothetical protein